MADEERQDVPEVIDLPAPTVWPLVTAFGVTLGFAGLVTDFLVTLVGIVSFGVGIVGWWRDVLPHEKHEPVPVEPFDLRPAPIEPLPEAVEHLVAGEGKHRLRIPVEVHPYSSGIKGGIVGGIAMAVVACSYGVYAYGSVWYPINLLAATGMASLAQAGLEQLKTFDLLAFVVAFISHGVISILVGMLFAALLPMLPRQSMFWGAFTAPLLWTALIYAFLEKFNPALNYRIDWDWFIASQMAYGLTAGFVVSRSQWIKTRQSASLVDRAGIERGGLNE